MALISTVFCAMLLDMEGCKQNLYLVQYKNILCLQNICLQRGTPVYLKEVCIYEELCNQN